MPVRSNPQLRPEYARPLVDFYPSNRSPPDHPVLRWHSSLKDKVHILKEHLLKPGQYIKHQQVCPMKNGGFPISSVCAVDIAADLPDPNLQAVITADTGSFQQRVCRVTSD